MCFKPNPKHEDLQEEELEELEDNDFDSDFEGNSDDNENPEVEVMVEDESSLEYSNLLELPLFDELELTLERRVEVVEPVMVGYGLGRAFVEMAGALVDRDGGWRAFAGVDDGMKKLVEARRIFEGENDGLTNLDEVIRVFSEVDESLKNFDESVKNVVKMEEARGSCRG